MHSRVERKSERKVMSVITIPSVLYRKLGEDGVAALAELFEQAESRWQEMRVTRASFDELRLTVERLINAQQATETQVARLVEAQRRTEERLEQGQREVWTAIQALAEAQRRTEERVERLEQGQREMQAAIQALAEAQRRTEERVERLEQGQREMQAAIPEAQQRTEERLERLETTVQRLAEAQQRTEERLAQVTRTVEKLVQSVDQLHRTVGSLSEDIGFGLEGIARVTLPGYLERHEDIHLQGPLGEELQPWIIGPEGREIEFDLYGTGTQDGQDIIILGEVRSRIYSDDVRRFVERVEQVKDDLPAKAVPVMFGYIIHPVAREKAQELGVLLVASYQR